MLTKIIRGVHASADLPLPNAVQTGIGRSGKRLASPSRLWSTPIAGHAQTGYTSSMSMYDLPAVLRSAKFDYVLAGGLALPGRGG
ncbi:MAG: hypothetical protein ACTS6J_01220 [Burkholderiales bacterium]